MGQARDAPGREYYAGRWARSTWHESVDHPVFILEQKPLKHVTKPEPPNDPGHKASGAFRHPGTHVDRVRAHGKVVKKD